MIGEWYLHSPIKDWYSHLEGWSLCTAGFEILMFNNLQKSNSIPKVELLPPASLY